MIAVATTQMQIQSCFISEYKGTACGETYLGLLRDAEALGANAVLNACFDDALNVETLYHGAAVVIEPLWPRPIGCQRRNPSIPLASSTRKRGCPARRKVTADLGSLQVSLAYLCRQTLRSPV